MSTQYQTYLYERARHLKTEQWYWTYTVWCYLRNVPYDHADNGVKGYA
jgi:hypothetical protein